MWSQTCHSRWRHVLIKHCLCWTCVFNDNLLHYTSSALFNGVIALPDPSLKFCLHAYIAVLRSGVHSVFFLNGYLRPSRHTFDSNITAKFVTDSWKAFNKSQQCVAVCLQLILFMTYLKHYTDYEFTWALTFQWCTTTLPHLHVHIIKCLIRYKNGVKIQVNSLHGFISKPGKASHQR